MDDLDSVLQEREREHGDVPIEVIEELKKIFEHNDRLPGGSKARFGLAEAVKRFSVMWRPLSHHTLDKIARERFGRESYVRPGK